MTAVTSAVTFADSSHFVTALNIDISKQQSVHAAAGICT